jgi:tRNA-Thr(GGU) m(6)t(6)A37 methyltransferase TsaA
MDQTYHVRPVGWVRSPLRQPEDAPRQCGEGAPEATLVIAPEFADAAADIRRGDHVVVLTWLHLADRSVQRVHPRGDRTRPLTGVFSTRSPARPNPVGLHEVEVLEVTDGHLRVAALEAVDGTPVIDLKSLPAERRRPSRHSGPRSGADVNHR